MRLNAKLRNKREATIVRTWYCYEYIADYTVKHRGITQDPQRRQVEHRQRWVGGFLRVIWGPVTEAQARAWEAQQSLTITPERR